MPNQKMATGAPACGMREVEDVVGGEYFCVANDGLRKAYYRLGDHNGEQTTACRAVFDDGSMSAEVYRIPKETWVKLFESYDLGITDIILAS